jgi:ubiquinone/menaquinone biosynthesis C-methylase UbiE
LSSGDAVLEIGVGTGLSLEYFPADVDVYGIDFSLGMLRHSQQKAQDDDTPMALFQMDAQSLAFPDKSFDRILACYVMTVIPDPARALREIIRVAKPGARVVFINHLRSNNPILSWFEEVFHPIFSGIGLFTLDKDLLGILTSCGIEDFSIQPTSFFGLHYIISFTVPNQ